MKEIAAELEKYINQYLPALQAVDANKFSIKPSLNKWSKKELMGHLIDSAQCNIRRFVVSQYQESPTIIYNQDKCVILAGYQEWETDTLINLWYLLNKQASEILKRISPEALQRICITESSHTIEWLATDYIKHLRHHIHQILEIDPIPYP